MRPETGDGQFTTGDARHSLKRSLLIAAVMTLIISGLLQIWRPFYYLTDDNLSQFLPSLTEFCRRLLEGRQPFVSDGVHGGDYDLLGDPFSLQLVGPWMFLFSWLSLTKFYFLIIDIISICNSLAIASAFVWMGFAVRDAEIIEISDFAIVALAISYVFTPYNLLLGSSWIGFLNGQAALPLIVVGYLQKRHLRGVLIQAGALVYTLIGGNPQVFVMLVIFSVFISLGLAMSRRTWIPVVRIGMAGIVSLIVLLPLLIPALAGFAESGRAAGLSPAEASARNIGAPLLFVTMTIGPLATLISIGFGKFLESSAQAFYIGYAVINVLFLYCVIKAVTRRSMNPLSVIFLVCLAIALLLVIRPVWLSEIIANLPILRALRWPFREIWIVHFFTHAFVLVMLHQITKREFVFFTAFGVAVVSMIVVSATPTFYEFEMDRKLVVTNVAENYWKELGKDSKTLPRIVVGIDPELMKSNRDDIPFTLLGTYNFGSLWGFTSESGYAFEGGIRANVSEGGPRPYYYSGAYTVAEARKLRAQKPGVWLVELVSVKPARWIIEMEDRRRTFTYDVAKNLVVELDN